MNDVVKVDSDSIKNFARKAFDYWEGLEPWTVRNAAEYLPDPGAFGAARADTVDLEWEFHPMTPEEFTQATGIPLNPAYDPGDVRIHEEGTLASDLFYGAMTLGYDLSPYGVTKETTAWHTYYLARGPAPQARFIDPMQTPQDAPWSDKLYTDWREAVLNRLREVDEVRGEIEYLLPLLDKAAEDYANTDLDNEVDIDRLTAHDEKFWHGED